MKHILTLEEAAMMNPQTKKQMKRIQKQSGASAGSKKSSKDKTTTSTDIKNADTYGPKNESLIRDKSKKQMEDLNRTIKAAGGDIQDIVKKGEKVKEYQIPNVYYMDNPFDSKRTSIETQEHFVKNDAHKKSISMKSKEQDNIVKLNAGINENIDNDSLRTMNAHFQTYVFPFLTIEEQDIIKKLDIIIFKYNYDNETNIRLSFKTPESKDDVYQLILVNVTYPTYKDMVKIVEKLHLVSDYDNKNKLYLNIYYKNKRQNMNTDKRMNESSYTDFLTNYGKKINECLRQLRKMKKISEKMSDEDYERLEKAITKIMKTYDDNVSATIDHWINVADDIDANEIARFALENQDRFGTEPQMVLFAIDDAFDIYDIIAGNKVNESKEFSKIKHKKVEFVEPFKKLKNLKHFHELSYDGDTTEKSNVNDDSWIKGRREDFVRPMFKNLPDTTIRPSYDALRTGKMITLFGRECRVMGIKNGELTVDVMGKDDKHETQIYDMKDVLKEIKKTHKKEKKSKK